MASQSVLADVVERSPLSEADGKSGAALERVKLADGTVLVVKHVDPASDWVMQSTRDPGRVATLYEAGVFGRLPAGVDSAIVAVEPEPDGCAVIMRDVSAALLVDGKQLTRDESRLLLGGASQIHRAFTDAEPSEFGGLCDLADVYGVLSPRAVGHLADEHVVPRLVLEGWERFGDLVPADVSGAVLAILDRPTSLADVVGAFPSTLLHGDFKLANLGIDEGRVVVLDWGSLTCWAPPAVEFAWYLAINAAAIDATLDQLLEDIESVSMAGPDDAALRLALLGGLVQLGWDKALSATVDDPDAREREQASIDWWVNRARQALEHWSPT